MFNTFVQVGLTGFTILGFLFTSMKLPQYGLLFTLASQGFWLYSSYQAWKKGGQWGIFVTTIVIALIVLYGVLNYWFLNRIN